MESSTNQIDGALPSNASKNTKITTKDWNLDSILRKGQNFLPIPTVNVASLEESEIERLVLEHEGSGIPLLMQNFHLRSSWESDKFSPEWLREAQGQSRISVRNVHDREDRKSSIADFLDYAQAAGPHAGADEEERLYAKDAPCPLEWHNWILENLPQYLLPFGKGDVSAYLSPNKRVETLMTYLGIGDTYTPAHKDSCASVGQNLMVHAADDASSFWFLTSTDNSYDASVYWRKLGRELDHEDYIASVDELSKAQFPIYVCQQRLGDFIIVPPRSCHQVLNSGGLTIKMSWSRMIPKSCTLSLTEELPIYQRVCRPEIYRVKATIAAAVSSLSQELDVPKGKESQKRFYLLKEVLPLYIRMLNESYDPHWKSYTSRDFDEDSCDSCGADLWQSAMVCYDCSPVTEGNIRHGLVICGPCYVDGRSCRCGLMHPHQALPFNELLDTANRGIAFVNSCQDPAPSMELLESGLTSLFHPPFFRVANFLNRYRHSNKTQPGKKCHLYRSKSKKTQIAYQNVHEINTDQGVLCDGCHARACWYHIAEKYNTHIIEVATMSESYQALQRGDISTLGAKAFTSEAWHESHAKGKTVGASGSSDKHWAEWLPRLAKLFRSNRPICDSVLLGWYDGAHLGPLELVVDATIISSSSQITIPPASASYEGLSLKRKVPTDDDTEAPSRKRGRPARQSISYVDSASEDELDIIPYRSPVKRPTTVQDTRGSLQSSTTAPKGISKQTSSVLEVSGAPFPLTKAVRPVARPAAASRPVARRATTRKETLDTRVELLKEQVERLTAENEEAKTQTAAASLRQEEAQAEMARLWRVVRDLQAKLRVDEKAAEE